MVYTERAEMAAVSCGISHASAVSTPLRWILKNKYKKTRYKKLFTHVESHASAVSLLESGEQSYIKAINNNNNKKNLNLCQTNLLLILCVSTEIVSDAKARTKKKKKGLRLSNFAFLSFVLSMTPWQ